MKIKILGLFGGTAPGADGLMALKTSGFTKVPAAAAAAPVRKLRLVVITSSPQSSIESSP
jgi:hypothetical protein